MKSFVFPQDEPGTLLKDKYQRAGGLEVVDLAAIEIMGAICTVTDIEFGGPDGAAETAYILAEALMAHRDKRLKAQAES